jgi:hypothetical protein
MLMAALKSERPDRRDLRISKPGTFDADGSDTGTVSLIC